MWLILAIILITTIGLWSRKKHAYFKERGIPQVPGYFPFGSVANWKLMTGQIAFPDVTSSVYDGYRDEPFVGYYGTLGQPILLINDLEWAKRILVKDFDHFTDRRMFHLDEEANKYWMNTLVALNGEKWRQMRNIVTPIFTTGRLKNTVPLMNKVAVDMKKHMAKLQGDKDGLVLNPKKLFGSYAFEVIMASGYGVEVNAWDDPKNIVKKKADIMMGYDGTWNAISLMVRFLSALTVPGLCKVLKMSLLETDGVEFFADIMRQTLEKRKAEGVSIRRDLVDLMIEAFEKQEDERTDASPTSQDQFERDAALNNSTKSVREFAASLSKAEKDLLITSQALILFFAGFDTTSTTLTLAMHFMATNPECQEKLFEEISGVVDRHGGDENAIDYADLNELHYTEKFLMETMRAYNFVGAIERVCTKDFHIPEANFTIPKGMLVQVAGQKTSADDKYFDNPDTFDPGNFDEDKRKARSPYAFLIFGQGPRNCIGMRFAYLQMKLVMAHIVNNYVVLPCDKTPKKLEADPANTSALPRGGVWVEFKKRN